MVGDWTGEDGEMATALMMETARASPRFSTVRARSSVRTGSVASGKKATPEQ